MIAVPSRDHPLKVDPGQSQEDRVSRALDPAVALIDPRDNVDWISLLDHLADLIVYYDGSLAPSTWRPFFDRSNVFQFARIAKTNVGELAEELTTFVDLVLAEPDEETLDLLLNYLWESIVLPMLSVNSRFRGTQIITDQGGAFQADYLSDFSRLLRDFRNDLSRQMTDLKAIQRIAAQRFCVRPRDVTSLLSNAQWEFAQSPAAVDLEHLEEAKEGETAEQAIMNLAEQIRTVGSGFIKVWERLRVSAARQVPMAIREDRHAPQIALLLTFLGFVLQLQRRANKLTERHLDFFYRRILHIDSKVFVPDVAHLLVELQKKAPPHLLTDGTLFRNGKDVAGNDVLFSLDNDTVFDGARVTGLKTFFMNRVEVVEDREVTEYVEGLYIAPFANSLDGLGEGFDPSEEGQWPTLGARESPLSDPDERAPVPYPHAHIGFVLASPVLLLQEGRRRVVIEIQLQSLPGGADSRAKLVDDEDLNRCLKVSVSGKDDWISLDDEELGVHVDGPTWELNGKERTDEAEANDLPTLRCEFTLKPDFPAVVPMAQDAPTTSFGTTQPAVKVELRPDCGLSKHSDLLEPCCPLERCKPEESDVGISLYNHLRCVVVSSAQIDVEVCGVKQVIAQNEEGLLDSTGTMALFGNRPNVPGFDFRFYDRSDAEQKTLNLIGPSFYIGSNEVFGKAWKEVRLHLNWKDKPADFRDYYKAYLKRVSRDQVPDLSEYGLDESGFQVNASVLEDGRWRRQRRGGFENEATGHVNQHLLPQVAGCKCASCSASPEESPLQRACEGYYPDGGDENGDPDPNTGVIVLTSKDFWEKEIRDNCRATDRLEPLKPDTRQGFIRLTLENQDFLHNDYPFVLARQMMAMGRLPDDVLEGAVYAAYDDADVTVVQLYNVFSITGLERDLSDTLDQAVKANDAAKILKAAIDSARESTSPGEEDILKSEFTHGISIPLEEALNEVQAAQKHAEETKGAFQKLKEGFIHVENKDDDTRLEALIPNEPYTPQITDLTLDYTATASYVVPDDSSAVRTVECEEIELVHLYPFEGTYKRVDKSRNPTLVPTFFDEGSLYIGLEGARPGGNVNLLVQLADSTVNAEGLPAMIEWDYLSENEWLGLQYGSDVTDETNGLTVSGIVKIALPRAIHYSGHTVMPDKKFWLKASAREGARSVPRAIDIHAQAAKVTYTPGEESDLTRLGADLPLGSIAKLASADATVKKIVQPYPSRGGSPPESAGRYYARVSERLRHRGRALARWDYERLVMEQFREVGRVKCISHTLGLPVGRYHRDLELAPGLVLVVVVPNLRNLAGADLLEPRLGPGHLMRIEEWLRERTSPFVRLSVRNPRYERLAVELKVRLARGVDQEYFTSRLADEIRHHLTPWVSRNVQLLRFGRGIRKSDLVGFIERRPYVDFICSLMLKRQDARTERCEPDDRDCEVVHPFTARSIFVPGVVVVDIHDPDCIEVVEDATVHRDDNSEAEKIL